MNKRYISVSQNIFGHTSVAGLNEHVYEEVKTDRFEGLRVRWQAPECVKYGYFSAASDVWAFGVLTYEVLTYGCIPYRNVKDDDEVASRVSPFIHSTIFPSPSVPSTSSTST